MARSETPPAGTDSGTRTMSSDGPPHAGAARMAAFARWFWLVAGAVMLADIALTIYGLELGLREINPVARAALDGAGVAGLVGLKTLALAVAGACWYLVPDDFRVVVPLGLLLPSLAAVIVNVVTIGVVLG